jgi:CRP-like cAMP-binding protein
MITAMAQEQCGTPVVKIGLKHVELRDFVLQDELLFKSDLFRMLTQGEIGRLLCQGQVRSVRVGQRLLSDGKRSKGLLFILKGSVQLWTGDGQVSLQLLGKGDFFGTAAVVETDLRPGATAAEDTQLALLPSPGLRALMAAHPDLEKLIRQKTRERERRAEELAGFLNRW